MRRFEARYEILPEAQRRLWPHLKQVPQHFVLYGGTAIALRLGHRHSLDFDFFSSEPVVPDRLLDSIPFLKQSKILQSESQTLTVSPSGPGNVKVSFFGGLTMGRVSEPEETGDGVLLVASLLDLAATKAKVVQQRAEAKDYIDLLALIDAGIGLASALGAAQALYREQFNPMVTLKALAYFGDGDLHKLKPQQREHLTKEASLNLKIPAVKLADSALSPKAGE